MTDRVWLAVLATLFVASRLAAAMLGVRFDLAPLDTFYQVLDLELLRTNLAESLAHLHMQPPLFNLFVGVVTKLAGESAPLLFELTYAGLSMTTVASIYFLLRRFRVAASVAGVLTSLYLLGPSALLYEKHLFYPHVVVAFLSSGAFFLHGFVDRGRLRDGLLAFGLFAAVALTRSLFHLVWLLAVWGFVVVLGRGMRRRVLVAGAPAVLLVALWYLRSFVVFGSFAASSWFGMSFAKITTMQGTIPERGELIAQGVLSELAVVRPFRPFQRYSSHVAPWTDWGVAALDAPRKSNGRVNLNYGGYLAVEEVYRRDAIAVVRHRPAWWLRGTSISFRNFFRPSWGGEFVAENATRIRAWDWPYRGLHMLGDWPLKVVFGLLLSVSLLHSSRQVRALSQENRATAATTIVLVSTVLWVFLVGNLLDVGENYRFRFSCTWILFVLAGAWVARLFPTQEKGERDSIRV